MAIVGVVGLPGSGKSYYITGEILRRLRRGGYVLSNFHPSALAKREFGVRWKFALWDEMTNAPCNTLCVVDEANMWFSSREWKGQSTEDLAVFKQSRKHGLDLWWCDQHENRVDCAIREVTHFLYRVERFFGISYIRIVEPSSGAKMGVKVFGRRSEVWDYYDSYECIGNRQGVGYSRGRASQGGRSELVRRLLRYPGLKPFYRVEEHPELGRDDGEVVELLRKTGLARVGYEAREVLKDMAGMQ